MLMDVYNKNKGEKPICSEIIGLDWYDGWMTGIFKLTDSTQWYIFNLCHFDTNTDVRYYSLVETSEEWAKDFNSIMGKDVSFEDLMNKLGRFFDSYEGNAFLLKARRIDETDYEINKVSKSALRFINSVEDTFEQNENSIAQLKSNFSYGKSIYYAEMKKLLKELQLFKLYSSIDEMSEKYWKFVGGLFWHGYDDYVVEFDNDISVRHHIETILKSEILAPYPEWGDFKKQVNDTDDILRMSFIPSIERSETSNWWQKGILKNGFGNYAADIKLMYGYDITNPL